MADPSACSRLQTSRVGREAAKVNRVDASAVAVNGGVPHGEVAERVAMADPDVLRVERFEVEPVRRARQVERVAGNQLGLRRVRGVPRRLVDDVLQCDEVQRTA